MRTRHRWDQVELNGFHFEMNIETQKSFIFVHAKNYKARFLDCLEGG
jgi:hypothetical protein